MATVAPAAVPVEEKPCRRRAVLGKAESKQPTDAAVDDENDRASITAVTRDFQQRRAEKEAIPNSLTNITDDTNSRAEAANNRTNADFVPDEPGAGEESADEYTAAEPPLPEQHVASVGDPSLPHILSIGPKGTSELFELAKTVFDSKRGMNIHSLGMSGKELANLYGVRSTEQIKAMQTAFGVKTRGATPPIDIYLEKRCQFKGFGLVKAALQKRLATIQEAQKLNANTFGQRRLGLQVSWINETLRKMGLATKVCPSDTAVTTETQTNLSLGTGACPCLDDMKFLRYMIYLMLLLQGHANEDVKRQIQQIPLAKILASVEKGDMTDATADIREAIALLSTLVQAEKSNQTGDLHEALVQIHMKLRKGQEVPSDISLQTILTLLDQDLRQVEGLQQSVVQVADLTEQLEKSRKELDDANEELAAKKETISNLEAQIAELEGIIGTASTTADTNATELAAKKETITEQASEIESLKRAKATLEQSLTDALHDEELTQATIAELRADQTRLSSDLAAARSEVAAKQTELDEVNTRLAAANEQIRTQLEQIADLSSTVETTRVSLQQTEERLAKCNEDRAGEEAQHAAAIQALEQQRTAAEAARADIQSRLDTATGEKGQLETERTAANARIAALESQLAALQASGTAKDEEYNQAKTALEAAIEGLRGTAGNLRDQLATEQAGRAQNAVTIRGLHSTLEQAQRNIEGLRGNLSGAEDTIQQKDGEITALIAEKAETKGRTNKAAAEAATALQDAQDATRAAQADASREKTDLSTQIQRLEQRTLRAEQSLVNAQKKATTDAQLTNQRLEKLLTILALDPNMLEQAKKYMKSDNVKEKEEIEGVLQKELCDFFRYFYDMTGIQMRKIHSLKFAPGNDELDHAIKADIFKIFPETPTTNPAELLREISLLFQELFTKGYMSGIPAEFTASGTFPATALAIGNYSAPLAPGISSSVINSIISGGGLLQSTGIEPIGNSKFKVRNETFPNEFTGPNPKKYTPLMILGIKFVQLVYQTLDTKYNDLARRCGLGDLGEARRQTDATIQGDAARQKAEAAAAARRKAEEEALATRLAAEEAARRKAEADAAAAEEDARRKAEAARLAASAKKQPMDAKQAAIEAFKLAKQGYTKSTYLSEIKKYKDSIERYDKLGIPKKPYDFFYTYLMELIKDMILTKRLTKGIWDSDLAKYRDEALEEVFAQNPTRIDEIKKYLANLR